VDAAIGALDAMGAVIGVTADHGMNDKTQGGVGGTTPPDIVFVEELLANHSGGGGVPNTTILPITDPYVVHHGALGSFATVHLHDTAQLGLATEVCVCLPSHMAAMHHRRDICVSRRACGTPLAAGCLPARLTIAPPTIGLRPRCCGGLGAVIAPGPACGAGRGAGAEQGRGLRGVGAAARPHR
jgi:hypothetical protein